jgi:hypothetical protein
MNIHLSVCCSYHYAPETSKLTPDYRVLNTWVEGDYHNAQLVCYSCDKWTRNSAKVTSQNQGWIFSNHYEYTMQSNDVSKPLTLHSDYGIVSVLVAYFELLLIRKSSI